MGGAKVCRILVNVGRALLVNSPPVIELVYDAMMEGWKGGREEGHDETHLSRAEPRHSL